jgi:hypothetical protein
VSGKHHLSKMVFDWPGSKVIFKDIVKTFDNHHFKLLAVNMDLVLLWILLGKVEIYEARFLLFPDIQNIIDISLGIEGKFCSLLLKHMDHPFYPVTYGYIDNIHSNT